MFEYTDIKAAPAALGYSQAAGNTLYASGAIGIDPETGKFAGEDVKSQCEQAACKCRRDPEGKRHDFDNVVKTAATS